MSQNQSGKIVRIKSCKFRLEQGTNQQHAVLLNPNSEITKNVHPDDFVSGVFPEWYGVQEIPDLNDLVYAEPSRWGYTPQLSDDVAGATKFENRIRAAAGWLKPSPTGRQARVDIPGGWESSRYSFTLVVEVKSPLATQEFRVVGYTDAIDDEMPVAMMNMYINSVTQLGRVYCEEPGTDLRSRRSHYVVHDTKTYLTRKAGVNNVHTTGATPMNVFAFEQTRHLSEREDLIDLRLMVGDRPLATETRHAVRYVYAMDMINYVRHAVESTFDSIENRGAFLTQAISIAATHDRWHREVQRLLKGPGTAPTDLLTVGEVMDFIEKSGASADVFTIDRTHPRPQMEGMDIDSPVLRSLLVQLDAAAYSMGYANYCFKIPGGLFDPIVPSSYIQPAINRTFQGTPVADMLEEEIRSEVVAMMALIVEDYRNELFGLQDEPPPPDFNISFWSEQGAGAHIQQGNVGTAGVFVYVPNYADGLLSPMIVHNNELDELGHTFFRMIDESKLLK